MELSQWEVATIQMGHPVGGTIPSGGSGSGAKSRLWELTFISDSLGLRGLPAKPFFYSVAMTRNDSPTVAGANTWV